MKVKPAVIISFSQAQHVAQVIDLLATWKRIQFIVAKWKNNSKVYCNISDNGIILFRNWITFLYKICLTLNNQNITK